MSDNAKRSHPRPLARLAGVIGSIAALAANASPVAAHPHVWVSVETTVVFENGSIAGFRHRWTFDEFYTAMAIHGLDTNKDGIYSRQELAELAQVNIEGLKEFGFFTFPRLSNQPIEVETPKDFWLEHSTVAPTAAAVKPIPPPAAPEPEKPGLLSRLGQSLFGGGDTAKAEPADVPAQVLTLVFTVPLRQPVLAEAPDFSFSIYDPSYFIAFDMAKTEPVKLGPGAPAGCRVEVNAGSPGGVDAQRLGDAFAGQLGPGAASFATSRTVKINCGPKS